MVRVASRLIVYFVVAGLAACGDNAAGRLVADAASTDAPTDAAPIDAAPIAAPGIGLAVVNSDFASSSISLIDPATRAIARADCVTATQPLPGNGQPLSGDVVLPSTVQSGNPVVAIDRHLAILTWFDPATCAPLRQLDVSTGFVSNPQDIASASPTKAYVSRLERNAAPTPDPGDHDEGDDLLIIDPSIPAITGRIDLSSYAVAVPGKAIQARPTATRIIGGTLYVALDSANEDFSSFGHGRVVAIDTATDQVTGAIDIAEFKNCTGLSLHPAFESLDVACGGAFSDLDQQVAGSGISFVDVLAAPPAETHHQSAAVFGGLPLAGFSGIALDRALGFGVTAGDFMTTGDQLWTYDATAGTAAMLTQTADSFVFGNPVLDPSRDLVYMTDATAGHAQIQVFSFANGTGPVAAPAILAADPALPPRSIAWY